MFFCLPSFFTILWQVTQNPVTNEVISNSSERTPPSAETLKLHHLAQSSLNSGSNRRAFKSFIVPPSQCVKSGLWGSQMIRTFYFSYYWQTFSCKRNWQDSARQIIRKIATSNRQKSSSFLCLCHSHFNQKQTEKSGTNERPSNNKETKMNKENAVQPPTGPTRNCRPGLT